MSNSSRMNLIIIYIRADLCDSQKRFEHHSQHVEAGKFDVVLHTGRLVLLHPTLIFTWCRSWRSSISLSLFRNSALQLSSSFLVISQNDWILSCIMGILDAPQGLKLALLCK